MHGHSTLTVADGSSINRNSAKVSAAAPVSPLGSLSTRQGRAHRASLHSMAPMRDVDVTAIASTSDAALACVSARRVEEVHLWMIIQR